MKRTPFYVIVADADAKTFMVEGPMTDDTGIVDWVVNAQKSGRSINCHTSPGSDPAAIAESYATSYGYKLVRHL